MIYIANPYTPLDKSSADMRRRKYEDNYQAVQVFTAWRLSIGDYVLSPIVHGHPLAMKYELPTDWGFWWRLDQHYMEQCSGLYVICLDGWEKSVGVTAEIAHGRSLKLPITYWRSHNVNNWLAQGYPTVWVPEWEEVAHE